MEWFSNIKEKTKHSFILFDIVDFYPSISENLRNQALSWASDLADISDEDISIITHARKSLLFNHGKPWIKNNNSNLFDVTMGSYDGAEICDRFFHLKPPRKNVWLGKHRRISGRRFGNYQKQIKTRKELHKVLEQFDLKITAEANLRVVNFLDVTFDLTTGKHKPYRKPNDDPLYIHKLSNHPPTVLF